MSTHLVTASSSSSKHSDKDIELLENKENIAHRKAHEAQEQIETSLLLLHQIIVSPKNQ